MLRPRGGLFSGALSRLLFEWSSSTGLRDSGDGGDTKEAVLKRGAPSLESPRPAPPPLPAVGLGLLPPCGSRGEAAGREKPGGFQAAQAGLDPAGAWASVPQGPESWPAAFTLWPAKEMPGRSPRQLRRLRVPHGLPCQAGRWCLGGCVCYRTDLYSVSG